MTDPRPPHPILTALSLVRGGGLRLSDCRGSSLLGVSGERCGPALRQQYAAEMPCNH